MNEFNRRIKRLVLVVFIAYVTVSSIWSDVVANAGEAEQPVHFADPALKAAVEEALGIANPTPTDMQSLTVLDANFMGIDDLAGLEHAINLHTLSLYYNGLTDVSVLACLIKLDSLNLAKNQISDVSPLKELHDLTILNLDNNKISDISPIGGLLNLIDLSLNDNEIVDISDFGQLTKLQSLSLVRNTIINISALSNLKELQNLNLISNLVKDVGPLAGLNHLRKLFISDCPIKDISSIAGLTGLEKLGVQHGQIENIAAISGLENLEYLYADGNLIVNVAPLANLKKLYFIQLSNNDIIDCSPIGKLKQMRALSLAQNKINKINEMHELTNLTSLNFSGNQISDIGALSNLTSLMDLDLSDNRISDINALRELTNLIYLSLSRNQISDISGLSGMTKLLGLSLMSNPLNCDAYCTYIPIIRRNNFRYLQILSVDPMPASCVCRPELCNIYYVDSRACGGNDGSSWPDAFNDLQDALDVAALGDEIRVAQGIYTPNRVPDNRFGSGFISFGLKAGVAVRGGYAGITDSDPNTQNVDTFKTVLSGDQNGNDVGECGDPSMDDNRDNVIISSGNDPNTILEGFTVTGGIGSKGSTIMGTIRNCTFVHNCSDLEGGALWYDTWSNAPGIRFIDCIFADNHAGLFGGAIQAHCRLTLERCRIINNSAMEGGGGIFMKSSIYNNYTGVSLNLKLIDCIFADNRAEYSSDIEFWGYRNDPIHYDPNEPELVLARVEFSTSSLDVGTVGNAHVLLEGDVSLPHGRLNVISSLLDGDARIVLGKDARLEFIYDRRYESISTLRASIRGPGRIEIDAGQQLILEGNAVVNLSSTPGGYPDPDEDGHIVVSGSLVVRGNATIESTNIDVKLLEVDDPNTIQYNNITLLESSTGFGGEFFVEGNARIKNNNIVSEGDRYLDLDPDPLDGKYPNIENNRITVIIKEGKLSNQGTLLELRAKDYDAGTAINLLGSSGAYEVSTNSQGFTEDLSENWVLERLILEPNAKLNLTNRQGFEFQGPDEPYPETVYVKDLVMGPNSVLNTALQTMYYQRLVDPNGVELVRDPNDSDAPLANGAKFVDIPMLGFSLGIIAMNDQMEFEVRVRKRLTDPDDDSKQPPAPAEPLYVGSIERIDTSIDPHVPINTGGVMEMRTQAEGKFSARSVAAKGAFARAGDESITIKFEYLFPDNDPGDAILVVYLSDHPEADHESRIPVAMIRPPEPGRPGSIQSNKFAVFSTTVPHGDLNFRRGTYVELELYGQNVRCWIDNWDPQIECTAYCGDYNIDTEIDSTDYLLLLAEFGLQDPLGVGKACLDFVYDGCVGIDDIMVWDAASRMSCLCPPRDRATSQTSSLANSFFSTQAASNNNPLNNSVDSGIVIFGKSGLGFTGPDGHLYNVNLDGMATRLPMDSGTGRLTIDSSGRVYQLFHNEGLVCIDDPQTRIIQKPDLQCINSDKLVSVGFNESYQNGIPLLDAAFHSSSSNAVYVVPVRVENENGIPYMAAAKLNFASLGPGIIDYSIETLYGLDPTEDPNQNITVLSESARNVVLEPDFQHLKEIGVDRSGTYIFVLSSCWENGNNWMLVYDEATGDLCGCVNLTQFDDNLPDINAPSSMVVSSIDDRIYLASSVRSDNEEDDLTAKVYCLTFQHEQRDGGDIIRIEPDRVITIEWPAPDQNILEPFADLLEPERYVSVITSMAEAPDWRLCVVGFTAPRFKEEPWYTAPRFFTRPMLAVIEPDTGTSEIYTLSDMDLPLSVVWK